jgi:hypothetical protein
MSGSKTYPTRCTQVRSCFGRTSVTGDAAVRELTGGIHAGAGNSVLEREDGDRKATFIAKEVA